MFTGREKMLSGSDNEAEFPFPTLHRSKSTPKPLLPATEKKERKRAPKKEPIGKSMATDIEMNTSV